MRDPKRPLQILARVVPWDKTLVALALESGVDGLIVEDSRVDDAGLLSRTPVHAESAFTRVAINAKADEEEAVRRMQAGETVILDEGWEIIPVENILAQAPQVLAEVASFDRAALAAGVLEIGVAGIVVPNAAMPELKRMVAELKTSVGTLELQTAVIESVASAGLGHRVCVDTISNLATGQGMLIGNSSAFTVLVHAETEDNPYVAARPFRINAGAVHAYALMPGDKTRYLEELSAGDQVLIVDATGKTSLTTIGRVKVEIRPMLLITAVVATPAGPVRGQVFLQNAETIRVVSAQGKPVSVVTLAPGDEILVKLDQAGRHFGMRIAEDIQEK